MCANPKFDMTNLDVDFVVGAAHNIMNGNFNAAIRMFENRFQVEIALEDVLKTLYHHYPADDFFAIISIALQTQAAESEALQKKCSERLLQLKQRPPD